MSTDTTDRPRFVTQYKPEDRTIAVLEAPKAGAVSGRWLTEVERHGDQTLAEALYEAGWSLGEIVDIPLPDASTPVRRVEPVDWTTILATAITVQAAVEGKAERAKGALSDLAAFAGGANVG